MTIGNVVTNVIDHFHFYIKSKILINFIYIHIRTCTSTKRFFGAVKMINRCEYLTTPKNIVSKNTLIY